MTEPLSRRRFIAITAAAAGAAPTTALADALRRRPGEATRWRGEALGAEAEITLIGPRDEAEAALAAARAEIDRMMAEFNLYDPASSLGQLNDTTRLDAPSPVFHALCDAVDQLHAATDGLFDPTVQRLWNRADDQTDAGWTEVARTDDLIELRPGLALTFNGIAQGFATDRVSALLAAHGFPKSLVNIGEIRGTGGPWTIGLADPKAGMVGTRTITDGAVATSSPGAMTMAGGIAHIVHPREPERAPLWSTVSVEADSATLADGLSTALCHANRGQMFPILAEVPGVHRVSLVDAKGDLMTLRPPKIG
ncbi:MAG: FAD:protein FMN transferase [Rhodobacteraceae bacterium]|nr:FAD:protein FMN transferase [Paracoccaceae bacterium]